MAFAVLNIFLRVVLCAILKTKPIRQLMFDLPECRITFCNKPLKFCGLDNFGPYLFREGRSTRKAWGLFFTCLCTRCLHVEVVTGLHVNSFHLAFSRFTSLRRAVDTVYSDNASTFQAAADRLLDLLGSTEFQNALRKSGINWVRIPDYTPSLGKRWEVKVKLFKSAVSKIIDKTRRMPSYRTSNLFYLCCTHFE